MREAEHLVHKISITACMPAGRKAKKERRRESEREKRVKIRRSLADNVVIRFVLWTKRSRSQAKSEAQRVITSCVLRFPKRSFLFFFFSDATRGKLFHNRCRPRNDQISTESQCLVWDARRLGTRTLSLKCTWKFSFSTFSPIEVRFWRSVVLFSMKKGLPHSVARLAKTHRVRLPRKRDGLSRFSDFLHNSKPKDQRLQVGLFY